MSNAGGGTQQPPLENDEYAPDETVLPPANRLLRPRRSFVAIAVFVAMFGIAASLTAVGISRLGPIELRPSVGDEALPPPKRPDRFSEQNPVEPPPFKSLVLDAARSYLDAGNLSLARLLQAKGGKTQ